MSVVTPSAALRLGSPSKVLQVLRGQERDGDLQAEGSLWRQGHPGGHGRPAGPGLWS